MQQNRSWTVIRTARRNLALIHSIGEVPAMKPRLPIIYSVAAICLLAACSSVESPEHIFSTIRENGVPVALSSGGPKYTEPLFTYEELYRLVQDESREESVLGGTGSPRMDADGNVYVGDGPNLRIAVFDRSGHFLRSMGREGSGPGEFRMIRLLGVFDDQVVACDVRQLRTTIFTTGGEFVRSILFPRVTMKQPLFFNTSGAYPAPGNRLVLTQQAFAPVGDVTGSAFRAGVHNETGDELAEVISPPAPPPDSFIGAPILHYIPGRGILHVKCPEPEMEWYDLDGSLRQVIRLDIGRDPVTAADRDRVTTEIRTEIENTPEGNQRIRPQRELDELVFPDDRDPWFGARIDEAGYIWAGEPNGSYLSPIHNRKWRVLSPDGEYLGNTFFPEVAGRRASGRPTQGHLVMSWEDEETGAPVVAVFRIKSAIRGFTYP